MFFDKKNKKIANERTIYQTRPNMILGCKKAIYGVIALILLFWISGPVKSLIAELQMYMISYIKLGLTGYAMLAIVLLMLVDLIYIIWQVLLWYSTSYTLTNQRIISKKGVINTKKTYMPYRSIQDIDLSQNILEKILNIGTVRAYSAYDNNSMELANIFDPSEVEEILFNQINKEPEDIYSEGETTRRIRRAPKEEYYGSEDMYAEPEALRKNHRRAHKASYRDSDEMRYGEDYYYPEDYGFESKDMFQEEEAPRHHRYEYAEYPEYGRRKKPQNYDYEYYGDNLEDDIGYAINDVDRKHNLRKDYPEDSEPYYNDYDYDSMEEFYQNNKDEMNIGHEEKPQRDSTENIVNRHFRKFNR